MNLTRVKAAVAVIAVLFLGTGCEQKRVNESEIGVYYTSGWIEGDHFERVMEPGSSAFVVNDHVYKLPARQISWVAGPGDNADTSPLEFTAKGGELMVMSLTTRFVLNTTMDENQEPFKTFFNDICRKYDCWDGALDGTPNQDDGWDKMLEDIVNDPQRAAANQLGLEYDGEALRYDNEAREEFAARFAAEFEVLLTEEVGVSNIFCGPGYERGENACPGVSVKVNNVRFASQEREGIREAQRLAEEQEELAVQERAAAAAQQTVNEVKATPEYIALATAEAMKACAANPECGMTFVVGADGVPTAVPLG